MSRASGNFVGKVRSNFMGTEFTIFDKGEAPQKASSEATSRAELGQIVYVRPLTENHTYICRDQMFSG